MAGQYDAGTSAKALRRQLLALLGVGDVDAALDAGLLQFATGDAAEDAPLRAAQDQLRTAWAARARHRARAERLDRQARERAARRAAGSQPAAATASAALVALPPAAAAALARARAKASGGQSG